MSRAGTVPSWSTPQTVTVSLLVSSPPPLLLLTRQLDALTATGGGLVTGSFGVQNAGGGSITINSASVADGVLYFGSEDANVYAYSPVARRTR